MVSVAVSIEKTSDLVKQLGDKVPLAVRGTLNDLGFMLRKIMVNEIKNRFTVRNGWTTKGIHVMKIGKSVKDMNRMEVWVGADKIRGNLRLHQDGLVVSKGYTPANAARVGERYEKLVSKKNYKSTGIKDLRDYRSKAKTIEGKYFALMAQAWRKRDRVLIKVAQENRVFKPGMYRFSGSKKFSPGSRGFPRMRMMYRKTKPTKIPARPWIEHSNARIKQATIDAVWIRNANRFID